MESLKFDLTWGPVIDSVSFPLQSRAFNEIDPIATFKKVTSSSDVSLWVDKIFTDDYAESSLLNSAEISMNKIIGFMIERKGFNYGRVFDILAERELNNLVSVEEGEDRRSLGALVMIQFYDRVRMAKVDNASGSKAKAVETGGLFCLGMKLAYLKYLWKNDRVLSSRIEYGNQLIIDQLRLSVGLLISQMIFSVYN